MGLVSMTLMLRNARESGYAVGAFNILDYNSTLAVVRAAEQLDAPVIVQTSAKTVKHWTHATIVSWLRHIAEDSPVPVALHLDHCKDIGFIRQCMDAGWTSVMIDASSFPFEQNLAMTRQVVEMAQPRGIGVEAEMGEIVGVEDDLVVDDTDGHLADPDKAVRFCESVTLATFAPAIGTAHGNYKGEPRIAFDRLEQISQRTGLPIALHGGTGLTDEVIQRCIATGCAKVNISTQLKHAFIDGFTNHHNAHNDYDPLKVIEAQLERMESEVAQKIEQFGGAGKASGLAQRCAQ